MHWGVVVDNMEFSKVLVAGGAGFIGSHVVGRLLMSHCAVSVLDNFCSGKMHNLPDKLGQGELNVVKGDIRDRETVSRAMKGVDAVIHLAALIDVSGSIENPLETNDVNVNGTLTVLNEALRQNVKKFLFASSAAVYGDTDHLPLEERSLPKPLSPYAASKISAEYYCSVFQKDYGFPIAILRYFNVYGPRQQQNSYCGVITRFVSNALRDKPLIIFGDGCQTRDFIYVDDVVDASILALENEDDSGKILNVCTGKPVSINELASTVEEITQKDLGILHYESRKGDVYHSYGSPLKAREAIGFTARTSLREGLTKLVKTSKGTTR
jgi:UDP-glucose 4-epimerase